MSFARYACNNSKMKDSRFKTGQAVVFSVTFLSVVARRASLEGWSMVKPKISKDMQFESTWLGVFDTVQLFSYAIGTYINGSLCDYFSKRAIVAIGLLGGSLSFLAMALLGYLGINNGFIFSVLWAVEGYFLSAAWPGSLGVMGNWFSSKETGKVMGIWSSNASVGNIFGAALATVMFAGFYSSWEAVVVALSVFLLLVALLFYFTISEKPKHRLEEPLLEGTSQCIGFWEAWLIPGVIPYTVSYTCLKLLNYGVLMWLPFYLEKKIGMSTGSLGVAVVLYDVGGMLGSAFCGWMSDMRGGRAPAISLMLLVSIPLLFLFKVGDEDTAWMFFTLVPLLGILVNGACNIMSGAVATDLANHGNKDQDKTATISGILDGTGSLGAALGQFLIGWLQSFSWNYVFLFLIGVNITSLVPLVFMIFRKLCS